MSVPGQVEHVGVSVGGFCAPDEHHGGKTINVLIFSKDRALQVDATLRSLRLQCSDTAHLRVHVLFLASNSFHRNLYHALELEHPDVEFVPERAFKSDVERLSGSSEYLMFVVDDAIFTRPFSISEVADTLNDQQDAIGFSLRLGRNTTYCYPLDRYQSMPIDMRPVSASVLSFDWRNGDADFGYPLELSASVYRSHDVVPLLRERRYRNPNGLEDELASQTGRLARDKPRLLCFETSVAFCAPVNLVQSVAANRAGDRAALSVDALARSFYDGRRLRVDAYVGFVPSSAHQEVDLEFEDVQHRRPKVSVVVPSYMQAEYLREAIDSVVAQTFDDWELVVVNDGSPDATSAVAGAAIAEYPHRRIRVIETPNMGVAHARNTGIGASTGWMILPLDADDVIEPEMLERTVAALEADWDSAIAYTDLTHFDGESTRVRLNPYNFERLCFRNQMSYCSLYRRHAWSESGGYNPNMVEGDEDWDFWVACGKHGAFGVRVPGFLFRYRVRLGTRHENARRHTQTLRETMWANHPHLYTRRRRFLRVLRITPVMVRSRLGRVAESAQRVAGRPAEGIEGTL